MMSFVHLCRVRCSPYTRFSAGSTRLPQMLDHVRSLSDAPAKQKQSNVRKDKKPKGSDGSRSKEFELVVACLDAPMKQEPSITEEEKIRRYNIGRNYVIGRFREHNKIDHDITCKIKMKQHAIKMLPKNSKIRKEALKISNEMPPPWRNIPVWTPPIPDFDPSKFIVKGDD